MQRKGRRGGPGQAELKRGVASGGLQKRVGKLAERGERRDPPVCKFLERTSYTSAAYNTIAAALVHMGPACGVSGYQTPG